MEFETLIKLIVGGAAALALPIGALAAIAAIRPMWTQGRPGSHNAVLEGQIEALEARVAELEGERSRLAELEERVDFAERLLVRENQPPGIGPPK